MKNCIKCRNVTYNPPTCCIRSKPVPNDGAFAKKCKSYLENDDLALASTQDLAVLWKMIPDEKAIDIKWL